MRPQSISFLDRIERFLVDHRFKVAEFGRQALNDPSFVKKLRSGRSPRLATAKRVIDFMDAFEAQASNARRPKP